MCGLVGAAGAIDRKIEQVFRTMLILDTIRGDHSTGVAFIDKYSNGKNRVVKKPGPPSVLFRDKMYIDEERSGICKVLIGHNRFATRGKINEENAHPFHVGHIIGAHNGTLDNKWDFPDEREFETDSETFFNMVSKQGVEDAVQNCRGAWAFTFYDENGDTINLIRNKERQLHFTTTKDKKTFLWASEDWMLRVTADRVGVDIGKIHLLRENVLLTIPVSDKGLGKEVVAPLEGKPPAKVSRVSSYWGGFSPRKQGQEFQVLFRVTGVAKYTSTEYFKLQRIAMDGKPLDGEEEILMYKHAVVPALRAGDIIRADINVYDKSVYAIPNSARLVESAADTVKAGGRLSLVPKKKYFDHHKHEISREEWEKKYQYCTWCNADLDPDDDSNLMIDNGDVVCGFCQKDPEVRELIKAS